MPLVNEFESDSDRSQDLRRMHESSNYDGKRRVCQFNRRMLMLSLNAVTGQWKNIESLEVIKEYRTSFAMSMNIFVHRYRNGNFATPQRSRATQRCY
jgi:hypothetical protein